MKEMQAIVKVTDECAKRIEVGEANITKAVCRNTNNGKYESFEELTIIKPNEQTTVTNSPINSNEDAWCGIIGYMLTIGGICIWENRKVIISKCKEVFKKCKNSKKQKAKTVVKYTYIKETTESNNENEITNLNSSNNITTTKETQILEVEGDCEESLEIIKNLQEQPLKSKINSTRNTLKI